MNYQLNIEQNGQGVLLQLNGEYNGDDIFSINSQLYKHPELHDLRYQIWDMTQCAPLQISPEQMRRIAYQDRDASESNPNQIVALVGEKNTFRGIDRLYHLYAEVWTGFETRTFRTLEDAREWIAERVK